MKITLPTKASNQLLYILQKKKKKKRADTSTSRVLEVLTPHLPFQSPPPSTYSEALNKPTMAGLVPPPPTAPDTPKEDERTDYFNLPCPIAYDEISREAYSQSLSPFLILLLTLRDLIFNFTLFFLCVSISTASLNFSLWNLTICDSELLDDFGLLG